MSNQPSSALPKDAKSFIAQFPLGEFKPFCGFNQVGLFFYFRDASYTAEHNLLNGLEIHWRNHVQEKEIVGFNLLCPLLVFPHFKENETRYVERKTLVAWLEEQGEVPSRVATLLQVYFPKNIPVAYHTP